MDLFEVEETKSPRLLWIEKHGFLTHDDGVLNDDPDARWMAIIPFEGDEGKDIGTIMAESCRLYEECNAIGYAANEADAIEDCASRLKIPLWNEEGGAA